MSHVLRRNAVPWAPCVEGLLRPATPSSPTVLVRGASPALDALAHRELFARFAADLERSPNR